MYLIGAALIGIQTALGFGVGIYGIVAYLAGVAANAKSQYVLMAMRRLDNADALGLVGEKRQQYLREAGRIAGRRRVGGTVGANAFSVGGFRNLSDLR